MKKLKEFFFIFLALLMSFCAREKSSDVYLLSTLSLLFFTFALRASGVLTDKIRYKARKDVIIRVK